MDEHLGLWKPPRDLIDRRGARLTTHKEKIDGFNNIGLKAEFDTEEVEIEN